MSVTGNPVTGTDVMAAVMTLLEVAYSEPPSAERLRIWAKALRFVPPDLLVAAAEHRIQAQKWMPRVSEILDTAAELSDPWNEWTAEWTAGLVCRQVDEGPEEVKVPYVDEGDGVRPALSDEKPTSFMIEYRWPVGDNPVSSTAAALGGWPTLAARRADNLYAQAREAAEGVLTRQRNAVRADLCGYRMGVASLPRTSARTDDPAIVPPQMATGLL